MICHTKKMTSPFPLLRGGGMVCLANQSSPPLRRGRGRSPRISILYQVIFRHHYTMKRYYFISALALLSITTSVFGQVNLSEMDLASADNS